MTSKNQKTEVTSDLISLGDSGPKIMIIALVIGAIGLVLSVVLSMASPTEPTDGISWFKRWSFAYMTNFSFFLTISIGGLFFVTVLHLTRGAWGVVVRRLAEVLGCMTFPMLFLFLPILIPVLSGNGELYSWNDTSVKQADGGEILGMRAASVKSLADGHGDLMSHKLDFLSPHWFAARCLLYFTFWGLLSWFFFSRSLRQDQSGDKALTFKMEGVSTWGMILLAASIAGGSFDIQMSLAPKWFSTMYPVYFFAGGVLAALCTLILWGLLLQRSGRITDEITVEHYHDLAKLAFAFIVFWGYIAFSQFMLIWYANIPEETFWFDYRMNTQNGWGMVSLVLLFGHLLIPFLGIIARTVRRNKKYLLFASIYLLCMHWLDCFWIVMPEMAREAGAVPFPLIDLLCLVGMGGFYIAGVCWIAGDKPLIPIKDPRLIESMNFKNV